MNLQKIWFRITVAHLLIVFATSLVFRVYLLAHIQNFDPKTVAISFALGLGFDLVAAVYSLGPVLLATAAILMVARSDRTRRAWLAGILFFDGFFFLFLQVGEYLFYEEFKDRYNFIAVDYLVYTHEVVRNVWESYPLFWMIAMLASAAALLSWGLTAFVTRIKLEFELPHFLKTVGVYVLVILVLLSAVTEARLVEGLNRTEEILSKNSLHALFAAYRNNEIDFGRFYTRMEEPEAKHFVHEALEGPEIKPEDLVHEDELSIVRNIQAKRRARTLNVVLVVMESLSARYMKAYGNPHDLTPNLDRLAREGLFYDHIYATGTRTVRGLEALVLSVPPTPGQSILRRPGGAGLFNVGTVFREHGYKTRFIYGGRAVFDNMENFFSSSGYEVRDQSTFTWAEPPFTNAWGVDDESLFSQVIKASDESHANHELFFHVVMTTSNHRPYTYPGGRVAIPSGTGRDGAVQFSDFAIGQFLKTAAGKPWFSSTLFVFVADHNASVAGGSSIDPQDYLIPVIFYQPTLISPSVDHRLASQIDVGPTILGWLDMSYQSRFFGMDLKQFDPKRAFLGTYQNVGLLDSQNLTVLSPQQKVSRWQINGSSTTFIETKKMLDVKKNESPEVYATVAYYQTASAVYREKLLEERATRMSERINRR